MITLEEEASRPSVAQPATDESNARSRLSAPVCCVILVLAPILLMWRHTVGGAIFASEDGIDIMLPILALFRTSLLEGQLPLWNPYSFSGQSFAAHYNAPLFYPPNYLVAFMSPARYIVWTVALHMGLAAVGMWALMRFWGLRPVTALVAGLLYSTSPFFYAETERYQIAQILGWFPWFLIACEKGLEDVRWIAVAGLIGGVQLMCGHSQHVHLEALAVAALYATRWGGQVGWRRAALRLACVGTLAVAISAVSWLPLVLEMPLYTRAHAAASYYLIYGVQAAYLPFIVTREFAPAQLAFFGYHVPFLLFLLALWGLVKGRGPRGLRALGLVLVMVGMVCAAGSGTALEPVLCWVVPLYGKLRYRARYTWLTVLGLLWLACLGIDRILDSASKRRSRLLLGGLALLLGAILAQQFFDGATHNEPCDEHYSCSTPSLRIIPPDTSFHRVMTQAYLQRKYWGWGLVERFRNIAGFGTCTYLRYEKLLHYADTGKPMGPVDLQTLLDRNHLRSRINLDSPILRLIGLKYVLYTDAPNRPTKLRQLPQPVPHAFVCGDWKVVADVDSALNLLGAPDFDPLRTAVLEGTPSALGPSPGSTGSRCTVVEETTNGLRVDVDVVGSTPQVLVLSEMYDPGWTARIGGSPAEVFPVDVALRGVVVPPGRHEVRLSYFPVGMGWALALSAAGLACALALALLGRRS